MKIFQESPFLSGLLTNLSKGNLAPAGFQRPYVWSRSDCLALFQSLLKGYPIGAFLGWAPPRNLASQVRPASRLGPILSAPFNAHSVLLLDGQNRLATLAWALRQPDAPPLPNLTPHEKSVWGDGTQLVVDLKNRVIEFRPSAEASTGFTLPAAALMDSVYANEQMRFHWTSTWSQFSEDALNEGFRWFDEVQATIRNARVVFTTLENASPEEAKDAFLHICRVGVPMSQEDLEAAMRL